MGRRRTVHRRVRRMIEHDWSPHSDHCTACGLSRYDAEGFACVPSTADDPASIAELKEPTCKT